MSKSILIVFFILIFYIIFVAYSDFNNFTLNISHFKFEFLFLVLGLYSSAMFIKGIRQQLLFKTVGILIPLKKCVLLFMAGLSMEVTPAGSGKFIKSYYLKKKYGYSISKSFPIFIIERFYDLAALTIIISFTLFFVQAIEVAIITFIVIILLVITYFVIHSQKFFSFIIKTFKKIPLIKKLVIPIEESQEIFQSLTTKVNIIKNLFLSLVAFTIYAFAIFIVFMGFNTDLNIIFTTFVTFSSLLFGTLSFLPAGIGITEISLVGFLTKEGISLSLATTIMIMIRFASIWFVTFVGFVTTKLFLK